MYTGKYTKPARGRNHTIKKPILLLVSLAVLLSVTISGTLALLTTNTDPVNNTFEPSFVPNSVVEKTDNGVKSEVKLQNDGNIDAYIRAAVVVTWADDSLNTVTYHAQSPVLNTDYQMTLTMEGWKKGTDGFYYHLEPVAPGNTTGELLTSCKPLKAGPDGCHLSVEIVGQSIQAKGTDSSGTPVVQLAWGVTVNEDGSLSVQ